MAELARWASPSLRGAALYVPRFCEGRGAVPFSPARGDVSALTGHDRFCNRIAAVKPLFLLRLMSQVDPEPPFMTAPADGWVDREAAIRFGSPAAQVSSSSSAFPSSKSAVSNPSVNQP